jgi:hypothetical protein
MLPDWSALIADHQDEWTSARVAASGPRVAIATSLGLQFAANTMDSLLAVALTLRGAIVEPIFCDGALPACQVIDHTLSPSVARIAAKGPQPDFCDVCQSSARRLYTPLGLNVRHFSEGLTPEDAGLAKRFAQDWIDQSETADMDPRARHALAGALRFFGRAELPEDAQSRAIHARYLESAFLSAAAMQRLFAANRYDVVIAHHGIYTPQGLVAHVAREQDRRLVTWHAAYRTGRIIYQHRDTYHIEMPREDEAAWNRPIGASEDAALGAYLTDRETGAQDWITFQRKAPEDAAALSVRLDLPASGKIYLLAANVAWDARLHYPASAYGHMIDWALDTVRWFAERPDRTLIIRCHPGEVVSSPRANDRLDMAIKAAFPVLPSNVRVIPPEDDTNTYALAQLSAGVLVFNTKLGMEMAARGKPVLVAGDAWIRGKGFSKDATSPDHYHALLADPETFEPLTGERQDRARRYAYHFFFRRCIPLGAIDTASGWPLASLRADAFNLARPGQDMGMDIVCNGVLNQTAFEMQPDY